MNILLVGGSSQLMQLFVNKLNKEGHRVFQLTEEPKTVKPLAKVFEVYRFSYDDTCIRDVVESIHPDVTLFFGAYDINFRWNKTQSRPAVYTAAVFNLLMACDALGKGRFIYLSSEEVYQGSGGGFLDCDQPCEVHTEKGQAIAAGEGICANYYRMGKDAVILRLDHLYGVPKSAPEAKHMVARMVIEGLETGEIQVDENQRMMLLYYADAVEFVYQVICAEHTRYGLYQISSGEECSQQELAELIAKELGNVEIVRSPKPQRREPMLVNDRFREEFGIRIFNQPQKRIPEVVSEISRHASEYVRVDARRKSFWQRLGTHTHEMIADAIPFIENVIVFIPFFMFNNRAVEREYFQNIDFYLLYVLLFAVIYGQQQATFSSLLAIAGYTFRQMYHRSGFDVMLDFNTYIWIAQLLILGLVVGHLKDRLHAVEEDEKHEVSFLSKQIDDISDINVSNVRVKEILSSQIINQNDSFGKLYEVTSSLDKYEPSEVLFYAAEVLGHLMRSDDVAIYTVANRSYARLFSSTSLKARSLGNSINYQQMDDMYEMLVERKVYINKNMDERYPLMADAIYADDEMQLILMVWGIPWERMTLGQANMLTVIGYLIQNAVLRANRYLAALQYQRYKEGTNILEPEAFRSLVTAYLHAREKGLTECAVISIQRGEIPEAEAGQRIGKQIRQSDFIGELQEGQLYVLLANTNSKDAQMVANRFREDGFACQIQEEISV